MLKVKWLSRRESSRANNTPLTKIAKAAFGWTCTDARTRETRGSNAPSGYVFRTSSGNLAKFTAMRRCLIDAKRTPSTLALGVPSRIFPSNN